MLSRDDKECLEIFEACFHQYRKLPIVLYGLGKTTKLLLDNIHGYNIIGLMDRANVRDIVFGLDVITVDDAADKAKIIIMVSTPYAQLQIYRRIAHLREAGTRIFGVEGKEWSDEPSSVQDDPYWEKALMHAQASIDNSYIISFDIFDTLLIRKCASDTILFTQLCDRAEFLSAKQRKSLKNARIKAQSQLEKERLGIYSIEEIWDHVDAELSLSADEREKLRNLEFSLELENAFPRPDVVSLLSYAQKTQKQIILASDMYWPSKELRMLLDKCGINGYGSLHVSCEAGATKRGGSMWDVLKKEYGGSRIMHIGDDPSSDGSIPENIGIEPFLIKSSRELFEMSTFRHLSRHTQTDEDAIIIGLIQAELFNNAFNLGADRGRPEFKSAESIGYVCFGPLLLGYTCWLIEQAEKDGVTDLLFISRDGYVMQKVHDKIHSLRPNLHKCASRYFYTSRRIASIANIHSREDIEKMLRSFDFCGTVSQTLSHIFGVTVDEADEYFDTDVKQLYNDSGIECLIGKYGDIISKAAEEVRERYHNYLLEMNASVGSDPRAVDLRSSGTNLFNVGKLFPKLQRGYSLIRRNVISESFKSEEIITPYIEDSGYSFLGKFNITSGCDIAECIITSPDGMLIDFDDNGCPVFESITNDNRDIGTVLSAQKGILRFVDDFLSACRRDELPKLSQKLLDGLFGTLQNRQGIVAKQITPKLFTHYEYLRNEFRHVMED